MQGFHKSVLEKEILEALKPKNGWYIDGTLGDGGYTLSIINSGGFVLGIDADSEALDRTQKRFSDLALDESKYKLVQGNFRDLQEIVYKAGLENKFQGILFDLGVSSMQLESPERGFAFSKEGPLDMRMDPGLSVSARDLVNGLNQGELFELFTKLGEEPFAKKFAEAILRARSQEPIETTAQLARIIKKVSPGHRGKVHPATRIFQALRIAVNDELNALREVLPQALELLDSQGFLAVISFHSLEDRIVKNQFKAWEAQNLGESISKKPIRPSEDEVEENPRSRSAILRIFKTI